MTDRLAEIKRDLERYGHATTWHSAIVRELVAEVERLREDRTKLSVYSGNVEADRNRLRELLARLEWAGDGGAYDDYAACCPVCDGYEQEYKFPDMIGAVLAAGHKPDCWLAAELRR